MSESRNKKSTLSRARTAQARTVHLVKKWTIYGSILSLVGASFFLVPSIRKVISPATAPVPHSEVVWGVETDEKLIALTFDDGPNPVYTPQILDILKQYQAKATFFVLGKRVKMFPDIAVREVSEGHEIANHTFDHHFLKNISPEKLKEEIRQTQEAIFEITEQTPAVFRPPGGIYDQALIELAREDKFTVVMWSWYQDTKDWQKPGIDKIVNTVLSNVRNGDIVLFHDLEGDCSQTVEALKQILPELKSRGYEFVTVSDLLLRTKTL